MQIRRGCEADTERLVALAGQIFETEQEIPRALTPLPPENRPQWWCVEEDGALLGSVALYWEDNAWHMGRFVISLELRGRHVGTALLETALTDIFAQDIREVTMEARDTTVHILKKFGAETTGAPFSFYRGTVTPMRLTREAFWNSHTGGQMYFPLPQPEIPVDGAEAGGVDDMGAGVARHGADEYGQPRGQNFPLVSGGAFQHALGVLSHSRSPPPASADSSPTG